MPLYEFVCENCGPFEERRPYSASSSPARCPRCQSPARRSFTPPYLYRTSRPYRQARALEEKSAHEPEVVVRQPPEPEEATGHQKPIISRHPWAVGSHV